MLKAFDLEVNRDLEVVDNYLKCLHLCASDALDCKKWRIWIRRKQSHSDGESGDSVMCILD